MDGRALEGSTGSDTSELSRYKPSKMETTSVGTVNERTIKLEEFSEEEGQTFGRTRGKLDVAVTNGKVSSFSMQRLREKSKKVHLEKGMTGHRSANFFSFCIQCCLFDMKK